MNTELVNSQWQPHGLITHCGSVTKGNDWGPLERRVKDDFFEEAFGWNPQHPFITND